MSNGDDKWVALLRGVNVGGHNRVPMVELRKLAVRLGWRDVRSYIASGNLVFSAPGSAHDLARDLGAAMVRAFDVDVPVLVLSGREILSAEATCPWDGAGNLVHLFWCRDAPQIDAALLQRVRASDDEIVIDGRTIRVHTPSGVARSKVMAQMERIAGVPATARNLNTVRKLAGMVRA